MQKQAVIRVVAETGKVRNTGVAKTGRPQAAQARCKTGTGWNGGQPAVSKRKRGLALYPRNQQGIAGPFTGKCIAMLLRKFDITVKHQIGFEARRAWFGNDKRKTP